ncbi:MAG: hypothetical protein R3E88_11755 [Myxococcota bacterium]|nr:hypothetical protein [Myxococcales bacterium]
MPPVADDPAAHAPSPTSRPRAGLRLAASTLCMIALTGWAGALPRGEAAAVFVAAGLVGIAAFPALVPRRVAPHPPATRDPSSP